MYLPKDKVVKKIKLTMKETNCVLDFNLETEGDVGDYEKERLLLSMEKIITNLMEKKFYNIETLKFEISDTKPKKLPRNRNRKHGLFIQYYKDSYGELDLYYSWNGHHEMKWDSRYLMSEFSRENGILEYLNTTGYLNETIDFELKTIKKFY